MEYLAFSAKLTTFHRLDALPTCLQDLNNTRKRNAASGSYKCCQGTNFIFRLKLLYLSIHCLWKMSEGMTKMVLDGSVIRWNNIYYCGKHRIGPWTKLKLFKRFSWHGILTLIPNQLLYPKDDHGYYAANEENDETCEEVLELKWILLTRPHWTNDIFFVVVGFLDAEVDPVLHQEQQSGPNNEELHWY